MEQLTGLDATFLYLETPSLHMHVSMAAVFDPSTVPGGYSLDKLRDLISSRLVLAPIFRRRLVEVPFRLSHPYWVDDPSFDLDYHVRRATLPAPGGMAELAEFVGDVCSRQLDRTKTLWEMHIVEGLQGGNVAMVTKIHHSTIDGVSGAELLSQLFDLTPGPAEGSAAGKPAAGPAEAPPGDRLPSDVRLVAHALGTRVTKPVGLTRLAWKTGRAVLDVRRVRQFALVGARHAAPHHATHVPQHRHHPASPGGVLVDLPRRREAREAALDTTVNDVVLALASGALRQYLLERGELPDDPLVGTVPVSVTPSVANRRGSNKVSAMFVALPCQIEDPVKRLLTIRDGTKGAKEEHHALGADVLLEIGPSTPPPTSSPPRRARTHG